MTYSYVIDRIPASTPYNKRPGYAMTPQTITIHNTGNAASSARNERGWLTNPTNNRTASYHIVIDEREAIECIPLDESAWHSGDGSGVSSGNRTSIGVEICESGDYAKTLANAIELVADLLRERGWGTERLRRHYDWSGKICPRLMYDDGSWAGWEAFKSAVAARLEDNADEETEETEYMSKEDAEKIIRFLSAGWFVAEGTGAESEFKRLADEIRKVSK